MDSYSTFGEAGRRRRRRTLLSILRFAAFLAVMAVAIVAAYEVGNSQMRTEVDRLEQRTEQLQEMSRLLRERVAAARQQAEQAEERRSAMERGYREAVPQGFRKDVLNEIDRKLRSGIPEERLAFVLGEVEKDQSCDARTENGRVLLQTPNATMPISAVSFDNGRIAISGSGSSARDEEDQPQAWYDPEKAVELRFLTIAGELETTRGMLPRTHAMVLDDRELRFLAKPSESKGFVDITVQICTFP